MENSDKMNEWYYYLNHQQNQNHQTVDAHLPVRTLNTQHAYHQNNKWDTDRKDERTAVHNNPHGQTITTTMHTMDGQQHDRFI